MNSTKPILLVEDDEVDQQITKRCFQELHINNSLVITSNGEDALEYLYQDGNEKPCLILLDIKMSKMNGIELLRELKNNEKLMSIPVVILTTSEAERDRVDCFNLGIAGYMLKPAVHHEFVDVIRTVNQYWTLSQLAP